MPSHRLHVILVDDNPGDRLLAIRELTQEFPDLQAEEIIDQSTFDQALAQRRFDIVITDYQLHWGDGLQVLSRVKTRYPDCPVIMFTNSSNGELAARAMKAGLDDYVTKSPRQYIRLAGAVRSVIEYTRTSQQVVRLQSRLQTLLDRLNVGVFRASRDGQLIECNSAFLQLVSPEGEPIRGLDRDLYTAPPGNDQALQWEREVLITRTGGSQIWVLLSATATTDEGMPVIDGLLEDISERKQANDELERRVSERTYQLETTNQELEAFSYSVSHDLREPLRNMQGLAQALLEDFPNQLSPTARQYAQLIVTSGQQLDSLIQDLLTYSRIGRAGVSLQPINLNTVVASALAQIDSKLSELEADIQVGPSLPSVMGHFNTLVQTVLNLLSNALKFVAPGVRPRVRVYAERIVSEEEGAPARTWVRLWVEDNGIGIEPDNHQRIFRVFERLHGIETYPGTGIGLAIVRRGIERLGGRVGVESTTSSGSRFWIELPEAE